MAKHFKKPRIMTSGNSKWWIMMNSKPVHRFAFLARMPCPFHNKFSGCFGRLSSLLAAKITWVKRAKLAPHWVFLTQFANSNFISNPRKLAEGPPKWGECFFSKCGSILASFCGPDPLGSYGISSMANRYSTINQKFFNNPSVISSYFSHQPAIGSLFFDIPLNKFFSGNIGRGRVFHG